MPKRSANESTVDSHLGHPAGEVVTVLATVLRDPGRQELLSTRECSRCDHLGTQRVILQFLEIPLSLSLALALARVPDVLRAHRKVSIRAAAFGDGFTHAMREVFFASRRRGRGLTARGRADCLLLLELDLRHGGGGSGERETRPGVFTECRRDEFGPAKRREGSWGRFGAREPLVQAKREVEEVGAISRMRCLLPEAAHGVGRHGNGGARASSLNRPRVSMGKDWRVGNQTLALHLTSDFTSHNASKTVVVYR